LSNFDFIEVLDVENLGYTGEETYDLQVTNTHNFLVSELDVVAHNSGTGRCYDDDMMLVNWDYAPQILCVLDDKHPDFNFELHLSVRDAKHRYGKSRDALWFVVPDTREGWAQALEKWEIAAFEKTHKDKILILDFSKIRGKGSPIGGMQDRPASGPAPLMSAFQKAATIKGAGLQPWFQSMQIDHYFAEVVLVGGARRSARMSTKTWKDSSVLDFIEVKRPIEYEGLSIDEVTEYRKTKGSPYSFLWSSNNSVIADDEFWEYVYMSPSDKKHDSELAVHARKVFKRITECSYGDGTGEPGIINGHKLQQSKEGTESFILGDYASGKKFQASEDAQILLAKIFKRAVKKPYFMITNPCSEIPLSIWGGYCTIADTVLFHCNTIDEMAELVKSAARFLIRVNTMDSLYKKEVQRTNRIGISLTGVHETAWKFFKLGFHDLINEDKSKEFWNLLSHLKHEIDVECERYSKLLGVVPPQTNTTVKPSGSVSKIFGLTEGWHLPSMRFYLRNVQFKSNDPLVKVYKDKGYPTQELKSYKDTTIVGFPTAPTLTKLELGDKLITAAEATPEEQYRWIQLGEKYWIHGVDTSGKANEKYTGGQISYTLKYKPNLVGFKEFKSMMKKYQSTIRCCSVMPQETNSSYEYLPEKSIPTRSEYEAICRSITTKMDEEIGKEHVDCAGGACPVDFKAGEK